MTSRSLLTVVAALLGLALSAALAWSASQLAGQRIGLASEPLAVTQGLAPHHRAVASPKPVRTDHEKVSAKPAPRAHPTPSPQIFSTSTSAPAATTAASSSAAGGPVPSSGTGRPGDDHHPDD